MVGKEIKLSVNDARDYGRITPRGIVRPVRPSFFLTIMLKGTTPGNITRFHWSYIPNLLKNALFVAFLQ